jgi:AcrR family transcriptional regulator
MREKIITKATELFLNYGFKSVTMDDIASELGMSKKTIYVHFANKTKLVEATTFHLFDVICDGIDEICDTASNPIEELYSIKKFVLLHLKNEKASPQFQLKKYYPQIHNRLKTKQFEKMHKSVLESLTEGVETGVFRDSMDIDFISRMYFTGLTGIKDNMFFPADTYRMEYLMERFLEYHLRAIVTEKGMTILNNFINKSIVQTNA